MKRSEVSLSSREDPLLEPSKEPELKSGIMRLLRRLR